MEKLKINFHLFEKCNMKCSYCFRNKKCENFNIKSLDNYRKIIDKLYTLNLFDRINFAGGEPTIMKELPNLLEYSKSLGFQNSLITNGYEFYKNYDFLKEVIKNIEIFGISIDSLDDKINKQIGRIVTKDKEIDYLTIDKVIEIYQKIKEFNNNIKFKINTVFSYFNKEDDSLLKISQNNIIVDRWKFLSVHHSSQEIKMKDEQLELFVDNFKKYEGRQIKEFVIEKNGSMNNSYIMINSLGDISCFAKGLDKINIFENSKQEIKSYIEKNLDTNSYLNGYEKGENHENTIHM